MAIIKLISRFCAERFLPDLSIVNVGQIFSNLETEICYKLIMYSINIIVVDKFKYLDRNAYQALFNFQAIISMYGENANCF